jgi:hypothetical protein
MGFSSDSKWTLENPISISICSWNTQVTLYYYTIVTLKFKMKFCFLEVTQCQKSVLKNQKQQIIHILYDYIKSYRLMRKNNEKITRD